MLDKRTLNRINDRPRNRGRVVYVALGTLAVAAAVAFLVSYALAAIVLLVIHVQAVDADVFADTA